jgi:DNA repair protein RecO (recombination protein O)
LVAVSPRSGRAVSAAEAAGYEGRLLQLPAFVRGGGQGSWPEIADGLRLTGHFLRRDVLAERWSALGEARERLAERLRRAGALG